jgi:hypothetical protein
MLIHASKYEPMNLEKLPSLESTPERPFNYEEDEDEENSVSKA